MATFAELLVRIGGDATGFTTAMSGVSASLDKTLTDAEKKIAGFGKLGASMSNIGTSLTAGLTLPIAAVGIAATKMAADFELGMRKVTSLLGGATQKEFKELYDGTLKLSRALGVDAVNAADGLYMAISSGIPKENALTFLEIASKAAIAGLTDTRVAVDGMTTILQAFGLQSSETQKVADAMFQAVNIGKMEFPELAASIGLAAGTAKALNVSYRELLAAGATLTNTTGQKIPEAMTMLQSAMKAVIEPTADMQRLIKALGYESGVALINAKGLEGGLQAISSAAGGNIEVLAAAFGRIEGLRATLGLTGDNARKAAADLDSLRNSTGAATKAFDEIDKSTARQFTRLKAELSGISIELGTALLPAVNSLLQTFKPLVGMLADAVRGFTALPQPIQQMAMGIAALAAALGPAIYLAGNLVTGYGAIIKALAIATPQIVAFGTALTTGSVSGTAGVIALKGALSSLAPYVVAIGGAWAAWEITKDLGVNFTRLGAVLEANTGALTITRDLWESLKSRIDSAWESVSRGTPSLNNLAAATVSTIIPVRELATALEALKRVDWWEKLKDGMGVFGAYSKLVRETAAALEYLTGEYPSMDAALAATAEKLKRFGLEQVKVSDASLAQYAVVKGLAGVHNEASNAMALAAKRSAEVALVFKHLKEEQERLNQVVADAKLRYDAVARSYNDGKASAAQLSSALGALTKAQRAADPTKWIEDQDKANASFQKWAATLEQEMLNAEGSITKARWTWIAFSAALVEDAPNEQLQRMAESASLLGGQMANLHKMSGTIFFAGAESKPGFETQLLKDVQKQTEDMIAAEKLLGVQSLKTADDMKAAFEVLKQQRDADGNLIILNDYKILRIKRDILAQEIKEAEAAGEKVTATQRKQLEEYEKILGGHGNKIKSFWRELGKEIEGIARGWAVDIGRGLWDMLLGKGRREFNRGLDEQTADLNASLAERSTEWAAYQSDIASQQEAARQNYEITLAEERAALDASLAERTKDYADAEADNAQKLDEVRAEYAKKLAGTLSDLSASLEERRGEYDGYVLDINQKLQGTRREHADQLAGQLSDLRDSLEDQRRSYSEYVDDVNKKLGRIGVDYAESIDDETKLVKAGIDDKNQEYKRDEEDILQRIARLKKAGKAEQDEEIQDLRKSLRRKKEDLDEYVREAGEKLAEFTSDVKRQNDREVADLAESLKERTAEWTRYQAENAKKRTEAIAKNAADLAEDERDLAKSLASRTADWVKYQADNASRVDAANAKYVEGLAKEEADLAASLAKKRAALDKYVAEAAVKWEKIQAAALASLNKEEEDLAASLAKRQAEYAQFVTDIQTKFDALVAAHRTAWDDIGGMMVSAFERAGESVVLFITDTLMGKLLDAIKKGALPDAITNLGSKIAGIFTGGGGAMASTIPSLPGAISGASNTIAGGASAAGGAGAGAAGAASSLMGTIGAVGAAVGAVSGVISNFQQAAMNKTLDEMDRVLIKIEHYSLVALTTQLLYLPKLEDIWWYNWNRQDKWFESLDTYAIRLDSFVGRIIQNLDERIAPAVEEARSILQEMFYVLRDGFGALPASLAAAVNPVVSALIGAPTGAATEPGARIAAQIPGSVPTTRGGEPTRRGVAIPLPTAAQYGSAAWLIGLLARQETTLANAVRGFDPNNPTGKEDWAAAYAANTGPAYQAWLTGVVANSRGLLAQWAAWAAAVAEQARATAANAGRAIVVNLEGGSARDQEFADMVINRYTRQLKAGGLL